MKKLINVMVLLVVMVCGMCIGSGASASENVRVIDGCDIYAQTTVVVEVNYDEDVVYCQDFNGNVWTFEGCEDWIEGDIASMVMYNSGTEIIYDDEILSVWYSGWFDGWKW